MKYLKILLTLLKKIASAMGKSCKYADPKYEVREHFAEAVELVSSQQNLKDLLIFTHEHPHHESPMMKVTVYYMSMVLTILHFIRASRQGRWGLHLASLEAICK